MSQKVLSTGLVQNHCSADSASAREVRKGKAECLVSFSWWYLVWLLCSKLSELLFLMVSPSLESESKTDSHVWYNPRKVKSKLYPMDHSVRGLR